MTEYLNHNASWGLLYVTFRNLTITTGLKTTTTPWEYFDLMPNPMSYIRCLTRKTPSSTCSSRLIKLPTELLLLIADNLDEIIPLHQACRRLYYVFRRRVLRLAVGRPTYTYTLLHWAIVHRDHRLVAELLGEECWRNQIDQPARVHRGLFRLDTKASALVWACLTDQPLAIIELFLSSGASPDSSLEMKDSLFTPLLWAIRTSRRGLVDLLLRYKASPQIPQEIVQSGLPIPVVSPIHLAVAMNDGAVVAELLKADFDVEAAKCSWYEEEWISPVEAAVAYSKSKVIKAFIGAHHGDLIGHAQRTIWRKSRVAPYRWEKAFEKAYRRLEWSMHYGLPSPPLCSLCDDSWWRKFVSRMYMYMNTRNG